MPAGGLAAGPASSAGPASRCKCRVSAASMQAVHRGPSHSDMWCCLWCYAPAASSTHTVAVPECRLQNTPAASAAGLRARARAGFLAAGASSASSSDSSARRLAVSMEVTVRHSTQARRMHSAGSRCGGSSKQWQPTVSAFRSRQAVIARGIPAAGTAFCAAAWLRARFRVDTGASAAASGAAASSCTAAASAAPAATKINQPPARPC